MDSDAARTVTQGWQEDNARGLALAAESEWAEASEAFAGAADALARALPADTTAHEPLAMVLGNLAQAYFRAGRLDDAIQQAQRTCALRVALTGEDGMPVARARMDLAVMLAAGGRLDEAMALVQRAIASIEHRVGDEDARLAIVLENAARIALAAGAPANAEPLLLRLHALLDAHGLSTARAEQLLTRIADVRAHQADDTTSPSAQAAPVSDPPIADVPASDVPVRDVPASDDFAAFLDSSLLPDEDWEDQPLRDAVVLTDVLLRSTPSGVPVIPDPLALETGPMDDSSAAPIVADVTPSGEIAADDQFTGLALDLADDFGAPAVGAASETPAPTPAPAIDDDLIELDLTSDVPAGSEMVLGFAVEHGVVDLDFEAPPAAPAAAAAPVPDALTAPLLTRPVDYPPPAAPAASSAVVPIPVPPPVEPPSPIRRVDITHAAPVSAPPVAPIADIVSTAPPAPLEAAPPSRSPSPAPSPAPASRPTGQQAAQPDRNAPTSRSGQAAPAENGGSSKLPLMIGGGVVAIGGAVAAWWFLLR